MRRLRFRSRRALRATTTLVVIAASLVVINLAGLHQSAAAADDPPRPHLLLIHGFQDSCDQAFKSGGNAGQPRNTTAYDFLTSSDGGGWTPDDVTTVGYYTDRDGNCDVDLNALPTDTPEESQLADDAASCFPWLYGGYTQGGLDDGLLHLGCEFAWYIYDTYTVNGIPVEIVAHSMGGLITRAAIGGATQGDVNFPDPLLVTRVVTVATPQGGVGGIEQTAGWFTGQGKELDDMDPNKQFMATMREAAFVDPQGAGGTFWALIGSSVPSGPLGPVGGAFNGQSCRISLPASWSLARALSCLTEGFGFDQYPDGDGVVQAVSQLGMVADYKVLYGEVEDFSADQLYVADPSTAYEHESDTCQDLSLLTGAGMTCTAEPTYLNDGSTVADTSAFVCTSSCNDTSGFSDVDLANPQHHVLHSLAEIASLLDPPATPWFAGHAVNSGDDYPYETLGQFNHTDEGTDAWNEYYGQCDSFAAWKVYENLAGPDLQTPEASDPPVSVPAAGWQPSNASISPVDQFTWGPYGGPYGNADVWASKWSGLGYRVDDIPIPGAIAWWPNATDDPQDLNPPDATHGLSSVGHVAFVSDVYPDGSITIEQYNLEGTGEYSVAHLAYGTGYTDTSFGRTEYVPWPSKFIHVYDGPQKGVPSPPEPPVGVVSATYPSQLVGGLIVLGPGDVGNDVTLAGAAYPGTSHGWSTAGGHGEDGQMLYTNTHHGAADSTATYTADLAANSCYRVDAFVPDTWSNNAAALYKITDQHFGTSLVPVDENDATNQWVELGVFEGSSSSGTLTVELTDQGAAGGQVAADAMRFVRQPDCTHPVLAAETLAPALAGAPYAGTVDGWYLDPGLGQLGSSRYTYTNGPNTGSSATWAATVIPFACYEVLAYVPNNHSDSYQAQYTITNTDGSPTVSLDENAFTDQFAPLGIYAADWSGHLTVELTDQSTASADAFVAADTMSFSQVSCRQPLEGATNPALTVGPGSPLSSFSVAKDWFNVFGYGLLGYAKWTHTNGSTPDSIATWTFTALPTNSCYEAYAYVPTSHATNTAAHYQGYEGNANGGIFMFSALINQADTAGWIPLGVVGTSSNGNTVAVMLDDTGPTGTDTGADAVKLVSLPGNCGVSGGLDPSAYPWPNVAPTTYISDGHGYYEGECVSFAAWAIRTDGLPHSKSPDNLGNADQWTGAYVDSTPHVGDIAQWDPNVNGAGSLGHVAYVAAVNADGTIEVYEYNWLDSYDHDTGHRLSIRTIAANAPSRYLHF